MRVNACECMKEEVVCVLINSVERGHIGTLATAVSGGKGLGYSMSQSVIAATVMC